MKMDATGNISATQEEFVISRMFNAPRKHVWSAWTEREQLMRWFGPQGYTITHAALDLHVGGIFHYAMRAPDGSETWGKWTFCEIASPKKLVLINSFSDAHGGITRHPMSRSWPLEMLSTTTFEAVGNKTKLTIRWAPCNATELERKTFAEAVDSMEQGWNGTFAQLEAYLEGQIADTADREIVISRTFEAPRELVWEAMANPQHVVNWWGPNGFTTTIEKMDFRVGGVWKHVMHGPDGTDYPNSSVFEEIVKPERIVYSHGGGKAGGPAAHFTATWTFEALGKQTRLTMRSVFDTAADRDLVVKEYGAIEGGKQTLARLDAYLAKMPAGNRPTFAGKYTAHTALPVFRRPLRRGDRVLPQCARRGSDDAHALQGQSRTAATRHGSARFRKQGDACKLAHRRGHRDGFRWKLPGQTGIPGRFTLAHGQER